MINDVEALKLAVQGLSDDELKLFRDWFLEYEAAIWDAEIEVDILDGKLDAPAEKVFHLLETPQLSFRMESSE